MVKAGFLGILVAVELYDCNSELLKNTDVVERIMTEAALAGKANIVHTFFKQFDPWGVSGALIVSESHIAIHTWPETNYAAIDIFTCGNEMQPDIIQHELARLFGAKRCTSVTVDRGSKSGM